ncbi:DUF5009 domain-containing protein [Inquilinus sp. KBS0705]|nr:DUF5009 domain-containing protein [Inquilinus sp. KBS0705]
MQQLPKRLLSVDVLRAVTMFFMIFVNDVGEVKGLPVWVDHAKKWQDALGFADIIFPGFLVIVGLSLPFAINNRVKKGESNKQIITYILTRAAALLIMGLFHVNMETYSATAILPKAVWALTITIAFFLIWLDYPATIAKLTRYSLITLGVVLLLAMAVVYKGGDDEIPHGMRPSWWGILGIIGWAYLVCAMVYYLAKGNLSTLIICWAVLVIINIIFHTLVSKGRLWVISDGASAALVMSGVIVSKIYSRLVELGKTQRIWAIFTAIGAGLIVAGLIIRPYTQGISKIRSTPAWVFICAGIAILVFEILVYLVDMRGKKDLFSWIRPAGTSTLTCYLMPYFQVYLLQLFHVEYPAFLTIGIVGILRSFATAFILIWLVGLMEKKHLRLTI